MRPAFIASYYNNVTSPINTRNDMAFNAINQYFNLINAFNYHSIAHKVKRCCIKDVITKDDVNNLGLVGLARARVSVVRV
jgi:hypothetical protein